MIDGEKLTGIKSGDIAAIFGNALDNAIECAAELPVEKSLSKYEDKDNALHFQYKSDLQYQF